MIEVVIVLVHWMIVPWVLFPTWPINGKQLIPAPLICLTVEFKLVCKHMSVNSMFQLNAIIYVGCKYFGWSSY